MSKSQTPPSVGRIVRYVPRPNTPEIHNQAEVLPAIIVRTWENTSYENDEVNLRVFTDGPTTPWVTSVPHSDTKEPGTWHWPEIAPQAKVPVKEYLQGENLGMIAKEPVELNAKLPMVDVTNDNIKAGPGI